MIIGCKIIHIDRPEESVKNFSSYITDKHIQKFIRLTIKWKIFLGSNNSADFVVLIKNTSTVEFQKFDNNTFKAYDYKEIIKVYRNSNNILPINPFKKSKVIKKEIIIVLGTVFKIHTGFRKYF